MSTSNTSDIQIEIGFNIMKSRRVRCMKFFTTFFNVICLLFGLVLMVICVIDMKATKAQPEIESSIPRGVLPLILAGGIALLVTGVVGCIAALREHVGTLYVNASFFIFVVSVELIAGVGGAVLSSWMGGSNELRMHFFRNSTMEDDGGVYQAIWDNVQHSNQCCGVDGPQDYAIIHRDIPASCCARAHPLREGGARRHLHTSCLSERTYYMRGCDEALRAKKGFLGKICISTGVIFTLVEVLCIVLAIWMARTLKSERRKLQANLQAHFES